MSGRLVLLGYGLLAYALSGLAGLYAVGFVGDVLAPFSVDRGRAAGLAEAVVVDVLLLALFAAQHSGMARAGFKGWWTRLLPAPAERSSYMLASCLALGLLFWQWRPIPTVVWQAGRPAVCWLLLGLMLAGWALALASTFLIDHAHLFGLRQVWAHFRGRPCPSPPFRARALYRWVRHPIMLGQLLAFWVTPRMTAGHLLFAAGMTLYVLVGVRLEERDLVRELGEEYRRYRERTPLLLPCPRAR